MCIRDSRTGSTILKALVRLCMGAGASYLAFIAALDSQAGAVSYTHLRAHETVLDLVCRLLLEKKK